MKLIYDTESRSTKLFNLKEDKMELRNIASENKLVLNKMITYLHEWFNHINLKRKGVQDQQPKFTKEQIQQLKSLGYIK